MGQDANLLAMGRLSGLLNTLRTSCGHEPVLAGAEGPDALLTLRWVQFLSISSVSRSECLPPNDKREQFESCKQTNRKNSISKYKKIAVVLQSEFMAVCNYVKRAVVHVSRKCYLYWPSYDVRNFYCSSDV